MLLINIFDDFTPNDFFCPLRQNDIEGRKSKGWMYRDHKSVWEIGNLDTTQRYIDIDYQLSFNFTFRSFTRTHSSVRRRGDDLAVIIIENFLCLDRPKVVDTLA